MCVTFANFGFLGIRIWTRDELYRFLLIILVLSYDLSHLVSFMFSQLTAQYSTSKEIPDQQSNNCCERYCKWSFRYCHWVLGSIGVCNRDHLRRYLRKVIPPVVLL